MIGASADCLLLLCEALLLDDALVDFGDTGRATECSECLDRRPHQIETRGYFGRHGDDSISTQYRESGAPREGEHRDARLSEGCSTRPPTPGPAGRDDLRTLARLVDARGTRGDCSQAVRRDRWGNIGATWERYGAGRARTRSDRESTADLARRESPQVSGSALGDS